MPVSVVVGGQYGSEGKGKVAHILASEREARIAIRVGGPNSGHTVLDYEGRRFVLRQLPTPAILPEVICVLPAGALIDPIVLLSEIQDVGLSYDRLIIDPLAVVVTESNRAEEQQGGLIASIGSTGSGAGSATLHRIARDGRTVFAHEVPELLPWIAEPGCGIRKRLGGRDRVVIEGTQGFGLSAVHSGHYPFTTSRDTTAAAAVAEAGLSPTDVDEVVLVVRSFPIRVGGHSGPLMRETTWDELRAIGNHDHDLTERTSVTNRIRRVAHFHSAVVRRAIEANNPSSLVMNHLDYVDHIACKTHQITESIEHFLAAVESELRHRVDRIGLGPMVLVDRQVRALERLTC